MSCLLKFSLSLLKKGEKGYFISWLKFGTTFNYPDTRLNRYVLDTEKKYILILIFNMSCCCAPHHLLKMEYFSHRRQPMVYTVYLYFIKSQFQTFICF